jgi:hypothetical protein
MRSYVTTTRAKSISWLVAAAIASVSLCADTDTASARETIRLGYSAGGFTLPHIHRADIWLRRKTRVIVTANRESAAAIQVIYFAGRGGNICVLPGVKLWLHMGRDVSTGKPSDGNRRYLGRSYREGWYDPAKQFGIPLCPSRDWRWRAGRGN